MQGFKGKKLEHVAQLAPLFPVLPLH